MDEEDRDVGAKEEEVDEGVAVRLGIKLALATFTRRRTAPLLSRLQRFNNIEGGAEHGADVSLLIELWGISLCSSGSACEYCPGPGNVDRSAMTYNFTHELTRMKNKIFATFSTNADSS